MRDEHIFLVWFEKYLNESACVANNLSVKLQKAEWRVPIFISAEALMKSVEYMTAVKDEALQSH